MGNLPGVKASLWIILTSHRSWGPSVGPGSATFFTWRQTPPPSTRRLLWGKPDFPEILLLSFSEVVMTWNVSFRKAKYIPSFWFAEKRLTKAKANALFIVTQTNRQFSTANTTKSTKSKGNAQLSPLVCIYCIIFGQREKGGRRDTNQNSFLKERN